MIQLIRVDDRLLHGQVAYSWKAFLGYEAIVIVSDSVATDDIRKAAIKMAKPDGVRLAIRNVKDALLLLKDDRLKNLKVFVVTDSIQAASELINNISEKVTLNIGGIQKKNNTKQITSFAYLTASECETLKMLDTKGINIEFKLVPDDKPKYFKDIIWG